MKRRSGFATIELPLVILIFGLFLLVLALPFIHKGSNIAWFLAIVGGLFTALGGIVVILLLWGGRKM